MAIARFVSSLFFYSIYFKQFCLGFTTAELHALETFAPLSEITDDPVDAGLAPIQPAFDKPKSSKPLPKHNAYFPLGNGREGYWNVCLISVTRINPCF